MRRRHLHWSADDRYAICGYVRWYIYRSSWIQTVHYSKARKSDCQNCRDIVREWITRGRRVIRRKHRGTP